MQLVPINAEVSDFADTAAIIEQLDLIITVDTSVAHLAGALGTPAWVLLSNRPDWRWQLEGEASPWDPTLRLFRQREDGAWAPAVAAIAAALNERRRVENTVSEGAALRLRGRDNSTRL
jgi:ADP-heptose:LPS heptosyltransferase